MYFLTRFLNAIVLVPELLADKYLAYFLTVEDEATFKPRKKEADKLKPFAKLEDVATKTGMVSFKRRL
jgi:hypothetical protein